MTSLQSSDLVLAMQPFARGLAFVLFEGPLSPIDWAIKEAPGSRRYELILATTKSLIDRYQPDVLVVRAHRVYQKAYPRPPRRFEQAIVSYAAGQAIECKRYTREEIRLCFQDTGANTRYEIAQAIAAHVPALSHRLPPVKKLWQSEDRRMALFDAASLALTHFCNGGPRGSEDNLPTT